VKVKLFTHTDLDGIGCAILGKLAFDNNISIEYCNYDEIDNKVKYFLDGDYLNYDKIYITDISVDKDTANKINEVITNKILLFDHHQTSLWLNKYNWAKVIEKYGIYKTCGAQLFYIYLVENNLLKLSYIHGIQDFVQVVREYDTWEWKINNYIKPKQWNDLLYIYGRDNFIELIINKIKSQFNFDNTDYLLLKLEQEKVDRYIEDKDKKMIVKKIQGYNAGIVFAEQYISELGNKLSELHPGLDFIIIINLDKSVSYRTAKDNINLGVDIAKIYGGGGHPKAAGSPISDDIKNEVIDLIFDKRYLT
jgi:oligoribonuclease NrnB/cAMP/cGMP phosphodiesterase (DHH superfamily)